MTALPERADHRAYVEAVRSELLTHGIRVDAASFTAGPARSAAMPLHAPDEDADAPWHPTFTNAELVELRWTEEDGWSLAAVHSSAETPLPTVWHPGFAAVPPPDEVTTWLALLLTMPGASASREDGPYRSHRHFDGAFEALLAAYAR